MANGHGGYRRPSDPAPVSGPGALSRRTDGGPGDRQPLRSLPNSAYGENKAFEDAQRAAPLARSQAQPVDTSSVIPMSAPTTHPDQPVTTGMVTPSIRRQVDPGDLLDLRSYLKVLKVLASLPQSTSGTRQLVRQLEGRVAQEA